MPQIAKLTGVPRTTVRGYLIRAGISLQPATDVGGRGARKVSSQSRWNSPYGFTYVNGRLEPHPQEFETLRLILKLAKARQSFAEISAQLNAQNLRPRSATAWTRFTVRQIVRWHEIHPDVLIKREDEVLAYQPWDGAKSNFVNQPDTKRKKQNGIR